MIDKGHGLGFDGSEWNFSSAPVRLPYADLQTLGSCAQCHADGGRPHSWCDPWPEKLSSCDQAKEQFELVMTEIQQVTRWTIWTGYLRQCRRSGLERMVRYWRDTSTA